MLSLSITDGDITIKDIMRPQLSKIIKWFDNKSINHYKYSMGMDKPLTIDELHEKYLEVLINAHEYFLGISYNGCLVGFIKGRADYKDEGEVWIMSMLIDEPYQNEGVGGRALRLIMNEFKEKFGIKNFYACLVKDNEQGKVFWKNNGFSDYRSTKDYFTIDNKSYDLIIMSRQF
jgi:RimJ/RimL family protein N-acetyltransferase